MKLTDIFPLEITFWTTLWYIFLAYFIAFIVFNIYIYANDLEYTINCKKNDKSENILPRFLYSAHPTNKYDPSKLYQIWSTKIKTRDKRKII